MTRKPLVHRPATAPTRRLAAELAAQVIGHASKPQVSIAHQYLGLCTVIEAYLHGGRDAALFSLPEQGRPADRATLSIWQ